MATRKCFLADPNGKIDSVINSVKQLHITEMFCLVGHLSKRSNVFHLCPITLVSRLCERHFCPYTLFISSVHRHLPDTSPKYQILLGNIYPNRRKIFCEKYFIRYFAFAADNKVTIIVKQ